MGKGENQPLQCIPGMSEIGNPGLTRPYTAKGSEIVQNRELKGLQFVLFRFVERKVSSLRTIDQSWLSKLERQNSIRNP